MRRYVYTRAGFTLLELLVVIAIIGVLAAVVIASLNSSRTSARNSATLSQVDEFRKALDLYYSDAGGYPVLGQSAAARRTEVCLGTSCWTGATGNGSTVRNILAPQYIANFEGLSIGPAYHGCIGQGFNDFDFDNDGSQDCDEDDYSLWFLLEGHEEDCGRAYRANANYTYSGVEYTMCRLMPVS